MLALRRQLLTEAFKRWNVEKQCELEIRAHFDTYFRTELLDEALKRSKSGINFDTLELFEAYLDAHEPDQLTKIGSTALHDCAKNVCGTKARIEDATQNPPAIEYVKDILNSKAFWSGVVSLSVLTLVALDIIPADQIVEAIKGWMD